MLISQPDRYRPFLRFAFEGVAYQCTVLPFGLSLAPRTFTKCMDVTLSPLRQMRIRILNYLDDWLVLAQSEVELLSHISLLLSHLECLRLSSTLPRAHFLPAKGYCSWDQFCVLLPPKFCMLLPPKFCMLLPPKII